MSKKYIAEFIGTFALSFTVLAAVSFSGGLAVAIPVLAALTLGLFVYTIGPISGCHINPAVTLGLYSIKEIKLKEALWYILSQFLGAILALIIGKTLLTVALPAGPVMNLRVVFAEALGTMFFAFGIASVVKGKAKEQMSGLVVGGSLLLGVMIASLSGSLGILNPAVAFALGSFNLVYIFSPIVGSVAGFHLYDFLLEK